MRILAITAMMLAVSTTATAQPASGSLLAKDKNCFACHEMDKPFVGPSFKDIANRYAEDSIEDMAVRIKQPSNGVWGKVSKPPFATNQVSDDEAMKLAEWILKRKSLVTSPAAPTPSTNPAPTALPKERASSTQPAPAPKQEALKPTVVGEVNESVPPLVGNNGCMSCHTVDGQLDVVPSFVDIAKKHSSDHMIKLKNSIQKGSVGNWGDIPCPPHMDLSGTDIQRIVLWILNRKPAEDK